MNIYKSLIIFVISVAANATPFFGTPYTIIATSFLVEEGLTIQNFISVVLITAIGATIAKIFMYVLGLGIKRKVEHGKNIQFLLQMIKPEKRSFDFIVFVTAALPLLPIDDFVFLLGGIGKISLSRMLFVTLIAKLVKSTAEIPIEAYGLITFGNITHVPLLYLGIITSVALTILGIVLAKVDLEELYNRFRFK